MIKYEGQLVNEMVKKSEFLGQMEERAHKKRFRPYISVSREPGSGGRPVARELAKRMGFKLFDKELLAEVASKMQVDIKVMRKVDEKSRSGITDFVQGLFNPNYVSDQSYFVNMCREILELSYKGGVVIVGRGANFIAPKSYGLQVQIVAPYRVRVARAVEFEHVSKDKAREIIKHVSADRSNYIRQYFGKNIWAPKYYDLTINSTYFEIDQICDLIIEAYHRKFPEGVRG